jgi:hypothetical protein
MYVLKGGLYGREQLKGGGFEVRLHFFYQAKTQVVHIKKKKIVNLSTTTQL